MMGKSDFFIEVISIRFVHLNTCKTSTKVPELQDVVGPKSMVPPLTAQTPGPNWLKFFVEAPQEDTFRGIEGIFEFRLRS